MEKKEPELLELIRSVSQLNKVYNRPDANWKVRDELSRPDQQGQRHIVKNRTTAIVVGQQTATLSQLLRGFFVNIVGPQRFVDQMVVKDNKGNYLDDFEYIADFLTNPNARNSLMMFGTTGTGKSTMMEAIRRTINYIYRDEIGSTLKMQSVKASQLSELMKEDKEKYRAMRSCTVLFLDDLGFSGDGEVVNDYGVRRYPVEDLFEYRYDKRLMTICTSNLNKVELEKKYGDKVYSRFCELFTFMPMTGADFRRM